MTRLAAPLLWALLAASSLTVLARADAAPQFLPPPALDVAPGGSDQQTAVFAGGCFWGVQGVFEHARHLRSPDPSYLSFFRMERRV